MTRLAEGSGGGVKSQGHGYDWKGRDVHVGGSTMTPAAAVAGPATSTLDVGG